MNKNPPTIEKLPDSSQAEDWLTETVFIVQGKAYEILPDMTVRPCTALSPHTRKGTNNADS